MTTEFKIRNYFTHRDKEKFAITKLKWVHVTCGTTKTGYEKEKYILLKSFSVCFLQLGLYSFHKVDLTFFV